MWNKFEIIHKNNLLILNLFSIFCYIFLSFYFFSLFYYFQIFLETKYSVKKIMMIDEYSKVIWKFFCIIIGEKRLKI